MPKKNTPNNKPAKKSTDVRAEGDDGVVVSSDGRKSVQINVRCGADERALWKLAAEVEGVPVGEWVRGLANGRADELLNCRHVRVRSYPSAGVGRPGGAWCLDCGAAV